MMSWEDESAYSYFLQREKVLKSLKGSLADLGEAARTRGVVMDEVYPPAYFSDPKKQAAQVEEDVRFKKQLEYMIEQIEAELYGFVFSAPRITRTEANVTCDPKNYCLEEMDMPYPCP